MNKLFKITIFISILFIIIISSLFIYYSSTKINEKNALNLATAEIRGRFTPYGNFTDVNRFDQSEPEIILTKDDVANPVYTLILNDGIYSTPTKNKEESRRFSIFTMYYNRKSITDKSYKITNFKSVGVNNITINELRKEVSQYDLTTQSRPLDIITAEPLTPEGILEAKRKADAFAPKTQLQIYQENCVKWFEYEVFMRQAILDKKSSVTYPDGLTVPVSIDLEQLDFLLAGKKEICNKLKSELQIP